MMAVRERLRAWLPARYQPLLLDTATPGRSYAEAVSFYLLTFGVFAVTAILDGAAASGIHPEWWAWASHWTGLGLWGTLAVLTLWLAALHACRLVWLFAVAMVGFIAGDALMTAGAVRAPDGVYELVAAITATLLAVMLSRRRGSTVTEFGIGRGWGQREYAGRRQAVMVFSWALAGSCLSDIIALGITALGLPHGHLPIGAHENPVGVMLRIVAAGLAEEVLVAVIVIALTAARRRPWEMYAVAGIMRVSYHMYYQAVGPSILAMGVLNVWLYRRTRRLTPIICAHIAYDVIGWVRHISLPWAIGVDAALYLTFTLLNTRWAKPPDASPEAAPAERVAAIREPTR